MRVVLDTNVVLSATLKTASTPAAAVRLVWAKHILLSSTPTEQELWRILSKPYFQQGISTRVIYELKEMFLVSEHIEIIETVTACRDPNDDKFLELALNGEADVIISGDKDLLSMTAYKGTRIITPAEFLTANSA